MNIIKDEIEFLENLLQYFDKNSIVERIEYLEDCKRLFIEKRKVFELLDQYMFNNQYKAVKELLKDEVNSYDDEGVEFTI